ncbi:MAG: MOSC N-terminal beta barrel domain-containing protein [Phaeodactylibacter sp.]|uniref:MOSC domain-containing protein n=1 Tax=Phaeodactylibacter sp. TaxID=1940289 RepID=UPI0032EBFC50
MKQISGIYIYPVKSLGGIALEEASIGLHGLTYDRQWMVVDLKGMFITQRKVPQMALIEPALQAGQLVLKHRHRGEESVSTPLSGPTEGTPVAVQVWNDEVTAVACADAVNEWLSDQLGTFCRLVYLPAQNARPLSEAYGQSGEATLFSDSCPLLITGEESLQDLNSHLAEPVPMSRFRPNLVFSGGTAFEEDNWQSFRIGQIPFRGIRKCTRCKVINIDQTTAAVNREPLEMLAQYRRDAKGIYFGLHASLALGQSPGKVSMGDFVGF